MKDLRFTIKKPLIALLLAAIAFALGALLPARTAEASDAPHIVINGDVWLLDEKGERLFLLPETYYARINNLDDSYYYVTFNGVSGKVSRNVVSTTGYHTVAQGTGFDMRVSDEFSEFVSINLKSAPVTSSENVIAVPVNESFYFVGVYPAEGGLWYYVKYGGVYGYIRSERTAVPVIDFDDFTPETVPVSTEPEGKKDDSVFSGIKGNELRIIIIIGLAIPAVLMIFLLFRPSKSRKYYD